MKINIIKLIFLNTLDVMKEQLDLLKFKFGKDSDDFKFFKSKIMDSFYNNLKKTFSTLESEKIVKKCECGRRTLRKGYSDCPKCFGSGYMMK